MDLKLCLEQYPDQIIQNMFYNRWTQDPYVSNMFVFEPAGVIIALVINGPGSWHDPVVAEMGVLFGKLP